MVQSYWWLLLLLLLSHWGGVRLCATPQPTRLPHPWDSPGKKTGVGCHFLLQCMKVKRESEVAQLCPTLRDPMGCSPPGSSIHGIFQARVLEWGAIKGINHHCPVAPYMIVVYLLCHVQLFTANVANKAPLSMEFPSQEY